LYNIDPANVTSVGTEDTTFYERPVISVVPIDYYPNENRTICCDSITTIELGYPERGAFYALVDTTIQDTLFDYAWSDGTNMSWNVTADNDYHLNVLKKEADRTITLNDLDQYVVVEPVLYIPDTFTMAAWIKTTDNGYIFCWGHSGITNYSSLKTGVGKLRYTSGISNSENTTITGTVDIQDDVWHHVAVAKTADSVYLYVDGALDTKGAFYYETTAETSWIGGGWVNNILNGQFGGQINNLTIWERILTENEIACNMNYGISSPDPSILIDFSFDEWNDTIFIDRSGNGYLGKAVNFSPAEQDTLESTVTILDGQLRIIVDYFCDGDFVKTNMNEENIRFFPNPSSSVLNIELNSEITGTIRLAIYSSTGAIIRQTELTSGLNTLDISELPSGLYILKVENNDIHRSYRMMKE
jgi:hypothetical protein